MLAAFAVAAAPARGPDWAALARGIDGRLVLSGDPDYPEARQLFQPRYDTVAPGAVAYPAHAADVAVCLDFARRSAVPVVPRGGGHSYAGWSTCAGGLVVDVGAMAGLAVEGTAGVRIGAGARLGDVNRTLAAQGLAVPTGLCPTVGIAGLTLGGGLGLASRAHGTTSDALTGATVVTPDAVVREVDATRDPGLFWALRGGGGGNFGVVTEFRFRTHPATDCAYAELHWPEADSAALLRGWQRWLAALPDPFWSQVEFLIEAGPAPAAPPPYASCASTGAPSWSGSCPACPTWSAGRSGTAGPSYAPTRRPCGPCRGAWSRAPRSAICPAPCPAAPPRG